MKNTLIAERYARGLSAAIGDAETVRQVARDLRTFADFYKSNAELRNVLSNEAIHLSQRAKVLEEVLRQADAPEMLRNVCKLLLMRHRITYLPEVARIFRRIADERLGQVRAQVVTAVPMEESQEKRVIASLEKYTRKTVKLDTEVDPAIIGGVVAHLGSVIIDSSIKTRLERMRAALVAEV